MYNRIEMQDTSYDSPTKFIIVNEPPNIKKQYILNHKKRSYYKMLEDDDNDIIINNLNDVYNDNNIIVNDDNYDYNTKKCLKCFNNLIELFDEIKLRPLNGKYVIHY